MKYSSVTSKWLENQSINIDSMIFTIIPAIISIFIIIIYIQILSLGIYLRRIDFYEARMNFQSGSIVALCFGDAPRKSTLILWIAQLLSSDA